MTTLRYRQDGYFRANRRDNLGKNYITNNLGQLTRIALPPEVVVTAYSNTYSLLFDGVNEYLECGSANELAFDYNQPFSISVWLKPTGFQSSDNIVSRHNSNVGWSLGLDVNGQLRFRLFAIPATKEITARSVAVMTTGSWQHVFATFDGTAAAGNMKIYRNNVLLSTDYTLNNLGTTTTIPVGTVRTRIAQNAEAAQLYKGYMDELAIWNKELTSSDRSEIYNSGAPNNLLSVAAASNLVGWWRMGDGVDAFPTFFDYSTNNNSGSAQNMEAGDITGSAP